VKRRAPFRLCLLAIAASFFAVPSRAGQKDYLSAVEADKIRDAETTNERIKLFLTFADDRLKKFCLLYTSPSPRDLSTSRMPSSA